MSSDIFRPGTVSSLVPQGCTIEQLMAAANIHAYQSASMHAVRACGRRLADLSIGEALALRADHGWNLDVPWTGTTDDSALDRRLACAFRALLARATLDERLRWIEHEVWSPSDFPHPARPADPYHEALMRWWLELYGEAYAG